jgi:hypothetical protein
VVAPEVVAVLGEHRGRHWAQIEKVAFSPDGSTVLSSGADGVRIWDAASLREQQYFPERWHFALSPDGKMLTTDGLHGHPTNDQLRLGLGWSLYLFGRGEEKFTQRVRVPRDHQKIYGFEWTPDGQFLVSCGCIIPRDLTDLAGYPGRLCLWERKGDALELRWEVEEEKRGAGKIALAVGGKLLIDNGGDEGAIRFWSLAGDKPKLLPVVGVGAPGFRGHPRRQDRGSGPRGRGGEGVGPVASRGGRAG